MYHITPKAIVVRTKNTRITRGRLVSLGALLAMGSSAAGGRSRDARAIDYTPVAIQLSINGSGSQSTRRRRSSRAARLYRECRSFVDEFAVKTFDMQGALSFP